MSLLTDGTPSATFALGKNATNYIINRLNEKAVIIINSVHLYGLLDTVVLQPS